MYSIRSTSYHYAFDRSLRPFLFTNCFPFFSRGVIGLTLRVITIMFVNNRRRPPTVTPWFRFRPVCLGSARVPCSAGKVTVTKLIQPRRVVYTYVQQVSACTTMRLNIRRTDTLETASELDRNNSRPTGSVRSYL